LIAPDFSPWESRPLFPPLYPVGKSSFCFFPFPGVPFLPPSPFCGFCVLASFCAVFFYLCSFRRVCVSRSPVSPLSDHGETFPPWRPLPLVVAHLWRAGGMFPRADPESFDFSAASFLPPPVLSFFFLVAFVLFVARFVADHAQGCQCVSSLFLFWSRSLGNCPLRVSFNQQNSAVLVLSLAFRADSPPPFGAFPP